ncbi:MAG: AAA family ATPase [Candidatus Lokiarchaeota archaeon]|nr:AAA family ATPase [Candidatus Lokiarchaeota archaeon]
MILKKLKLKHVKCFEESEVEFSIGKNVIVGRNGSGKSTLFQSILYSLYAEYPLGTNDELIRLGENTASFELEFEHNGEPYIVSRQISNSGPDASLYQVATDTELAIKQTKTTGEIEKLLGISMDIFRDIIWVGQGEIAQIISMGNQDRKELFDKLLGLYDFETAHKRCRSIERTLESTISEAEKLSDAYQEPASKFDERETKLKELELDLKHKKDEKQDIQKLLEEAESKFTSLDEIKKKIVNITTIIEQNETAIDEYTKSIQELETNISNLVDEIDLELPTTFDIDTSSELKKKCEDRINELKRVLEDSRTAKQKYTEMSSRLDMQLIQLPKEKKEFEKYKATLEEVKEKIVSELPALEDSDPVNWQSLIIDEIESLKSEKEGMEKNLESARELDSSLTTQKEKLDEILNNIQDIKSEVEIISSKATEEIGEDWRELAEEDLRKVSAKIRGLDTKIDNLETEQSEHSKLIAQLETKIEVKETDLSELSKLDGKKCPKCKQIVDEKHSSKLRGELENEISQYEKELDESKTSLSEISIQLTSLKEEKENHVTKQEHVKRARDLLDNAESWSKKISSEKEKQKSTQEKIKELKDKLSEFDVTTLQQKLDGLETRIDNLLECKSKSEQIPSLLASLDDKKTSIEKIEDDVSELNEQNPHEQMEELSEKISNLENQLEIWRKISTYIDSLQSELEKLESSTETLRKRKSELTEMQDTFDSKKYDELREDIDEYKDRISSLRTRIETLSEEQIPLAKNLFADSKDAKEKLQQVGEKAIKAQKALKVVGILRSYYREVQKPLRRRGIRKASQNASEIFKEIIASNEFDRIRITPDHELKISRSGSFESMSTLSGGEQVIAGLSVRLGFARALATSDLLLLDEPTAYLDDQRRAELVETLNRITPARQILIVTHDDEFERVAQKVIHVRKDEGMFASTID